MRRGTRTAQRDWPGKEASGLDARDKPSKGTAVAGWRVAAIVLMAGVFIGACAPAAAPAPTSAPAKPTAAPEKPAAAPTAAQAKPAAAAEVKPASKEEWENTLAAARKEKLVINTSSGARDWEKIVPEFQKAFPDIPVEYTPTRLADFAARVVTEQQNQRYAWDVVVNFASTLNAVLLPADALQSIRPFFLLPEVTDNSKWLGGQFELYSSDKGPFVFLQDVALRPTTEVNRDFVSQAQFKSVDDLLAPSLRGKIVIDEPAQITQGTNKLAQILQTKGEDFVRRVLTEAQPAFIRDERQLAEWVVTGRHPIGIGVSTGTLLEFQAQGVGRNIDMRTPPFYALGMGVAVLKAAPHPNAAKVFVNWFLSREGQQAWVDSGVTGNSRRSDVPSKNPQDLADYNKLEQYLVIGTDPAGPVLQKVIDIYKSIRR